MVLFFSIQSCSAAFQPVNKTAIEKSIYANEYRKIEQELKLVSEEKKELTLLYIDHLNQNFDNPILKQLHHRFK